MVKFSVVVPVYNEAENLLKLDGEIRSVLKTMGSFEIIYVNDGSRDKSLKVLKSIKAKKVILDLQRNYGQSTAMDAGFKQAKGNFVISMDADLQNDPHDLPRMFEIMKERQLDVIAGWRVKRKDSLSVQLMTKIARFIRRRFISYNIHDEGCTLRIYTRQAVKQLDLWGEMHRYIIALLRWKGFRIGEMKVKHRKRFAGKTKYGTEKLVKGFIDLIYIWFLNKYSRRPLHLFGMVSILLFGGGVLIELLMIYLKLTRSFDLTDNGLFIAGLLMIVMSVQFFVSGVMIDMMIRNHFNSSPVEQRYIVREIVAK